MIGRQRCPVSGCLPQQQIYWLGKPDQSTKYYSLEHGGRRWLYERWYGSDPEYYAEPPTTFLHEQ